MGCLFANLTELSGMFGAAVQGMVSEEQGEDEDGDESVISL